MLIIYLSLSNSLDAQFPNETRPDFLKGVQLDSSQTPTAQGSSQRALQQKGPVDQIEYGSTDTNFFYMEKQQIELFGDAFIKYKEYDIKADYILLDISKNEVLAQYGYEGFKGKNKPSVDFQGQQISAKKLRFNFDTNNGIVYDAIVQQDQMFIHGATTKFVSTKKEGFQYSDQVIYNKNALISTCNLDHPHWGIRASKLKIIPEEVAVVGPSRLELAGIPVPAFLPFAFAPLYDFNAASSGLIFPEDSFIVDQRLGIGMRGLGYYFALSDKLDLNVLGDFYTRGSWAFRTNGNYYKRYKFRGNFGVQFSRQLIENEGELNRTRQDSYSLNLTHNQDSKAHPYRRIGGSLRFTVNDYDRRNVADASAQINGAISSNFSYSYRISPKVNFSTSITHSQNTQNRDITFTLPDVQFRVSRISPFDNPATTGTNDKWYEKIGLEYSSRLQNSFSTKDTLLFTSETLGLISPGITHEASVSASYNLLNYFSFNTNIDLDEWWYFKTAQKSYEVLGDSTGNEVQIINELKNGFKPYRDIDLRAGISTNIYGTINRSKGWFRGFRHTIRPSINLSYSPATNRFLEEIALDPLADELEILEYSPFRSQTNSTRGEGVGSARLFRSAPTLDNGGLRMTYDIQNLFEAKIYSKKDSTEKKIKLLNNLNIRGDYNFFADSLQWSQISYTGSIRLFKNITTVNFTGRFDPYLEVNDRRVNQTVWSNRNSSFALPFRFEDFTVNVSSQLTLADFRDLFRSEEKSVEAQRRKASNQDHDLELFDWFSNFRLRHTFRYRVRQVDGVNEGETLTNSITLTTGRIDLSENWGFGINNLSYDFVRKNFPIPQFTVFRDLHCWQMNFTWSPTSDIFRFSIGVSASPFSQYIKYETGNQVFGGRSFR